MENSSEAPLVQANTVEQGQMQQRRQYGNQGGRYKRQRTGGGGMGQGGDGMLGLQQLVGLAGLQQVQVPSMQTTNNIMQAAAGLLRIQEQQKAQQAEMDARDRKIELLKKAQQLHAPGMPPQMGGPSLMPFTVAPSLPAMELSRKQQQLELLNQIKETQETEQEAIYANVSVEASKHFHMLQRAYDDIEVFEYRGGE
eukprot:TRINITY_DN5172_c5_g1_i1.p1 TRINITY_DN5172_c5_g1~~TRINITY_DN5172_c5_g1_i1.p1  ORF type:complete len:214 (+),score=65.81 TRINITY_DN5172_c5_g1_i1:53-643(+)